MVSIAKELLFVEFFAQHVTVPVKVRIIILFHNLKPQYKAASFSFQFVAILLENSRTINIAFVSVIDLFSYIKAFD